MDSVNTTALAVSDLVARHQDVSIVHGVSFAIEQGGSLGLVGESGCGKTTVLRAIAGIHRDWDGRIEVSGHVLGAKRTLADRKQLQIVFQNPAAALNPTHTIEDVLREVTRVHRIPDAPARIREIVDLVALPQSVRERFPHQLSGGQRQRICIARALLVRPKLLLLDEPTSALDVSVQAEILNLLSALRRDFGVAFLLVSHDIAVVAHLCETIAVMQQGSIVETLSRDDIRRGSAGTPYAQRLLEAASGRGAPGGNSPTQHRSA